MYNLPLYRRLFRHAYSHAYSILKYSLLAGLWLAAVDPLPAYGQSERFESIENLLEAVAEETEVSPLLDAIDYFRARPLDLRTTTYRHLMLIPGFSAPVAIKITALVNQFPDIRIPDIADSLGLTSEQRTLLMACAFIGKTQVAASGSGTQSLTLRIRTRRRLHRISGFEDHRFVGSPLELYQRLHYINGAVEAGVTLEKDGGERSIADFSSGFVKASFGAIDVLAGDYYIQTGMGSMLWRSFGARKGANVIAPPHHYANVIRPYRSTTEQGFFRGAAAISTLAISETSHAQLALWYSSIARTATIDTLNDVATSLDADGLFRTETEISKLDALNERSVGGFAVWNAPNVSIGGAALNLTYSKPITSLSKSTFHGQSGVLASVFAKIRLDAARFAVEVGRDARGALGVRFAGRLRRKRTDAVIAIRRFAPNYRAPFGHNFGESATPGNETGVYAALRWRAASGALFTAYSDIYSFPEPTSTRPYAVQGLDVWFESRLRPQRAIDVTLRLRWESKTDALPSEDPFGGMSLQTFQKTRSSLRAEARHPISKRLALRLRFEITTVAFATLKATETGILQFAELDWRADSELRLATRIVLFETESFDSALWQYEFSVPGSLSNPPLFGKGMRWTALVQYRPIDAIALSTRYAITVKNEVEFLGSGVNRILGNADRQALFQVDIRL